MMEHEGKMYRVRERSTFGVYVDEKLIEVVAVEGRTCRCAAAMGGHIVTKQSTAKLVRRRGDVSRRTAALCDALRIPRERENSTNSR